MAFEEYTYESWLTHLPLFWINWISLQVLGTISGYFSNKFSNKYDNSVLDPVDFGVPTWVIYRLTPSDFELRSTGSL